MHARPGLNESVWGLGLVPWYIRPSNMVKDQSLLAAPSTANGRRLQVQALSQARHSFEVRVKIGHS